MLSTFCASHLLPTSDMLISKAQGSQSEKATVHRLQDVTSLLGQSIIEAQVTWQNHEIWESSAKGHSGLTGQAKIDSNMSATYPQPNLSNENLINPTQHEA
ncbi:hypothetical protein L596_028771 [Steinernema carpocapsae]|uniref:Uncharacterized protein n=1 Tax=Steinernema carpocapsae TaxID=34508 RepID=A0A4U5LZB1_STECR|nr:hypothetical protein L596_028771 [Steinernema carpocapsae]